MGASRLLFVGGGEGRLTKSLVRAVVLARISIDHTIIYLKVWN